MNVPDPWQNLIRQLEPEYDKLWAKMNNTLEVKFDIFKKGRKYVLALSKDYFEESYSFNNSQGGFQTNLDDAVEWLVEKLENRADVRRTSWAMWEFNNRKEAEKIITWFHLSCPK